MKLRSLLMLLALDSALLVFVLTTVHFVHGWLGVFMLLIGTFLSTYLLSHHVRTQRHRKP